MGTSQKGTALVTGGSSGMGLACVERLTADGYAVASLDLQPAPAGSRAAASFTVDVTDPDAVEAAVGAACDQLGAPTLAVTAAGIWPRTELGTLTLAQYRLVMDVNLLGTLLVAQAAAKRMERGTIVTFATIDAYAPVRRQLMYCASKAAVVAATRSMALELAPDIRVVGVAPGWVETEGTRTASMEAMQAAIPTIPLRRVAQPEEIAGIVSTLASDALGYVTGEIIVAAGGVFFR